MMGQTDGRTPHDGICCTCALHHATKTVQRANLEERLLMSGVTGGAILIESCVSCRYGPHFLVNIYNNNNIIAAHFEFLIVQITDG